MWEYQDLHLVGLMAADLQSASVTLPSILPCATISMSLAGVCVNPKGCHLTNLALPGALGIYNLIHLLLFDKSQSKLSLRTFGVVRILNNLNLRTPINVCEEVVHGVIVIPNSFYGVKWFSAPVLTEFLAL